MFSIQANRKIHQNFIRQRDIDQTYISELEKLLEANHIDIPDEIIRLKDNYIHPKYKSNDSDGHQLVGIGDGSLAGLQKGLSHFLPYAMKHQIYIEFRNLTFWNMIPRIHKIKTVGSTLKSMITGSGPTSRFDILKDLTGRIAPGLTLIMGPPGSGKTTLLKALSDQLYIGSAHLEGEITYNGDDFKANKYLPAKVSTYVDENDEHAPTLTVKETLEFAFRSTTGGHHSYQNAEHPDKSGKIIDSGDKTLRRVHNVMKVLGIEDCQHTIVGDGMIRGVSGGQKRRVTLAEMLVLPRRIVFMDAISNGLDSQTTLDIIKSIKLVVDTLCITGVISLLQPAPEVFYTFDELILLGAGQILYHGKTVDVLHYFNALGYIVPKHMDIADFLQELPTPSGVKFVDKDLFPNAPIGIPALANAWKNSLEYQHMINDMDTFRNYLVSKQQSNDIDDNNNHNTNNSHHNNNKDSIELAASNINVDSSDTECINNEHRFASFDTAWPAVFNERYPRDFNYHYWLCLKRHAILTYQDKQLVISSIARSTIISLISSSLFYNLPVSDSQSIMGILFFSCMANGLNGLSSLPKIFEQRAVFYKHSKALFFPAPAFALSQAIVMLPIQILEATIYTCAVYWIVGFSSSNEGGRFFTFLFIIFLFTLTLSQFFRFIGSITSSYETAAPFAGIFLILFVLFSGYIINANDIPDGWIWFYYINPMAYILKALLINEFTASDYNFKVCSNYPTCTQFQRYGDSVLEGRGFSTDYAWVWYSALILVAEYIIFIIASIIGYTYVRSQVVTLPTNIYNEEDYHTEEIIIEALKSKQSSVAAFSPVPMHEIINTPKEQQQKYDNNNDTTQYEYEKLSSNVVDPRNVRNVNNPDGNHIMESIDNHQIAQDRRLNAHISMYNVLSLRTDFQSETTDDNQLTRTKRVYTPLFPDGDDSLNFEPIAFAFKDIWYKVSLNNGKEIDLLKGVSGFLEPGTMTALMGSSGAGKTTLLDVLSGRKNTGRILGKIFLNGKPKNDGVYKKIIGYVEQFDTLLPYDTPRDAVEFSAAMRLPRGTNPTKWVDIVISLLELDSIENYMIGISNKGGMSFEQKKRISIAVELAANPSILFLDEPTTGLDSRSAQVVIRCIKRVIACGRSVVCTIHQPSAYIFDEFDSLLLLQKGGQTVFFGELGIHAQKLIEYFEHIPGVNQISDNQNPASWMLQVIGAGTTSSAINSSQRINNSYTSVDFHRYYNESSLSLANMATVNVLCPDNLNEYAEIDGENENITTKEIVIDNKYQYNATYMTQFKYLMNRTLLIYWRSPSYNVVRCFVNLMLALLYSSTYANQSYTTDVQVISRVALIYITTLMVGVIALQTVQPIIFLQRPSFYREKYISIYDIKIYTLVITLVEVPYLIISSAIFMIPFFFIVGFNKGDIGIKFFWYWLFETLSISVVVFLGHFIASSVPNEAIAAVSSGLVSTCFGLFAGFMIEYPNFPDFWKFMYWITPLHYSVGGIVVTQFNRDHTIITLATGDKLTAQSYVQDYYEQWTYSNHKGAIVALCIFIVVFRIGTYFALVFINHSKR